MQADVKHLRIRTLREEEVSAWAEAPGQRLPVEPLLRAWQPAGGERVILVTARDLEMKDCASLFGYADRRRGVAVVSTFRLGCDDPRRTGARLAKVIEHERGHLEGLRHCRTRGCVMSVARNLDDLDARGLQRCDGCRRPAWRARVAAAVVGVLALAAAQGLASLVKVKRPPYSAQAAVVLFEREPVLRMAGAEEARAAAQALNGLYAQITPPPIEAAAQGSGALLRAGGVRLAVVDRTASGGEDPLRYAQAWAARTDWLMRAKGDERQGCPSCHIRRLAEVEEAARLRRERRW